MTAAAPTAGPGAARGPWIASAALAVAIVVAAALAVVTLVTVPSSATEAEPAAAPGPSAVATPEPAPAPAGTPAVADTAGRALPASVATGVQGLYTALGTGDLAGIESRYAPSTTLDAAPWSRVAPLMEVPANREALLAALREPPQRRAGIYRYSAGGAVVGVDAQGDMAFLLLP